MDIDVREFPVLSCFLVHLHEARIEFIYCLSEYF